MNIYIAAAPVKRKSYQAK